MKPFTRLAAVALGALFAAGTPAFAVVDEQKRSDRVVGYWHSSTGTPITIAYTGRAATVWLQVFEKGNNLPQTDYTARWTSDKTFTYEVAGKLMVGTIERANRIRVKAAKGSWSAGWNRDP